MHSPIMTKFFYNTKAEMVNIVFEKVLHTPLIPTRLISPQQKCQQHGDTTKFNVINSSAKLLTHGHAINMPYDTASNIPIL